MYVNVSREYVKILKTVYVFNVLVLFLCQGIEIFTGNTREKCIERRVEFGDQL